MLKLKLQYFGHLMRRADSLEKTLMLGKTEAGGVRDDRGWDGWMASLTQWTWIWANPGRLWRTWETVKDSEAWCAAVHGVAKNWTWLSNWTRNNNPHLSVHVDIYIIYLQQKNNFTLKNLVVNWNGAIYRWGFLFSCMLTCVWLFVTSWTVAIQAPLSMDFSRQENWSGLPLPILGDLPNLRIAPASPAKPESKGKK